MFLCFVGLFLLCFVFYGGSSNFNIKCKSIRNKRDIL